MYFVRKQELLDFLVSYSCVINQILYFIEIHFYTNVERLFDKYYLKAL